MYKIIGGDGNEYGPASAEQLRQWIAEGRVSDQTKAQAEGSTEWRPLSSFPEFAVTLGLSGARRPVPPPISPRPLAAISQRPPSPASVPNYLVWSILTTLFCFPVFGIIAIIYSSQASSKQAADDLSGAMEASRKAKMWCWIAFATGIVLIIVGIAVLCVSAVRSFQTAIRNVPQYNAQVDRCLGERLAHETAKLLDNQGEVVVLSMAAGQFKSVVADAQLSGFKTGLSQYAEMNLVAVEGPSQQELMSSFEGVPPQFMNKVASNHPSAKAIVSFLGMPLLEKQGEKLNTTNLPRIVALNLSAMGKWQQQIRSGVVNVVVLPRYDVRWDKLPKTNGCNTLVESRYVIVTKENVDAMAQKMKQFYPTDGE